MTSFAVTALVDHLWQSTMFAAGAGCLTLMLRKNSARVRCLLWLAASAKFLLPFALLTALGAHIPWPRAPIQGAAPAFFSMVGLKIGQITHLGAARVAALPHIAHAAHFSTIVLAGLGALWACGVITVAAHWYTRWCQIRRALLKSTPTNLSFVIPVRSSSSQLEPAVVGIVRPVLLLPAGLERRLSVTELHAVLAHERCHVTSQDNLAATAHMFVEALFWFHPLIWWLGARIVDERERACDEQVLAEGHKSETYAEGILKVCEHYLGSGLACVAGIGGADLRHRIEGIMTARLVVRLSAARTLVIALAAGATFAVPVAMGFLNSPLAYAQTNSAGMYLGPPRAWELRDEVWLGFPDPARQPPRP